MGITLERRISLINELGLLMEDEAIIAPLIEKAYLNNNWFIPEFVRLSINNIRQNFLAKDLLKSWIEQYHLQEASLRTDKKLGIVMAGNIPLVGFHDFLCGFISGHQLQLKLSSKDAVLMPFIINQLKKWEPALEKEISSPELLKGCDAYIATGSNNSARYFDYYFSKYPHIIRRNRTSVAILDGKETPKELADLADDVFTYFGLGCRNVTKLFVPEDYDFKPLLEAFGKYDDLLDQHKYKHNFDYQLTLLLLNNLPYMASKSVLLTAHENSFSPISVLHYEHYDEPLSAKAKIEAEDDIQCIVGKGYIPFGKAQQPKLADYADNVDTMEFLLNY